MKGLESGKDKVKKICEVLKKETIEPALREAEEILSRARSQANQLLDEAQVKAQSMLDDATAMIEREKNVFHSSLNQACRQALEQLRQDIEERLFNKELSRLLDKHAADPKVIADILSAIVRAIDREGIEADLHAYIPAAVSASSVNRLLADEILSRLSEKGVMLSNIQGGVCVKMANLNITVDISDAALKELVARFIRKDFREMLFAAK